jgi:hypothetical protein
MRRKAAEPMDRAVELLEKLLAIQLHGMGVPQGKIAKTVGKQTAWVNSLLKAIPRMRQNNTDRD